MKVYYEGSVKLPYRKNASISKKKIKDYLLSQTHPVGKLKAKFFYSIGFSQTNVKKLEKLLRKITLNEDVVDIISSEYGDKYLIEGTIKSTKGKSVRIQTVWIIETGKNRPRFVTAYPV